MDVLRISAAGMNYAQQMAASAANTVASSARSPESSLSGDNMIDGLVGLGIAAITYKANARVFEAASEMAGEVFDAFA